MASLSSALVAKREVPAAYLNLAPAAPPATLQPRRRRNQPGNPDPDAEVVALSPRTLMATNRFVCEVCNKGFPREQNLQLHRRGHNLPWKLKQRSTTPASRKVYLCPETSCIHHDPSRALGDLTGIKKHFSRKHGEKRFRCEKCTKKYAVQSDWKAHMKTCGTREYRCGCGMLFSRRDSYTTHRTFCDTLAQETAGGRSTTSFVGLGGSFFSGSILSAGAAAPSSAFRPLMGPSSSTYRPHMAASSSSFFQLPEIMDFRLTGAPQLMHGPPVQAHSGGSSSGAAQPGINFSPYFPSHSGGDSGGGDSISNITFPISGHFNSADPFSDGGASFFTAAPPHQLGAHMSATALLQKAAQIGSSSSTTSASLLRSFSSQPKLENHQQLFGPTDHMRLFASIQGPPETFYPAASYPNVGPPAGFGSTLRRSSSSERGGGASSMFTVGEGSLTRDFLGIRAAAAAAASGGGGAQSSAAAADRKPPMKGAAAGYGVGAGGIRFK